MRSGLLAVLGLMAVASLGGCSKFQGEWLEEGKVGPNGLMTAPNGLKRMALKFNPPLLVQYGFYAEQMKVVDEASLQSDFYYVHDGRKSAQFGEMIATRDGDALVVTIDDGKPMRFTRLQGKSVFPPRVRLSKATPNTTTPNTTLQPAAPNTEPILASTK